MIADDYHGMWRVYGIVIEYSRIMSTDNNEQ